MQKKDVIYVDVEDDITAIVGKIKASGEKIVAIVPPKRMGVFQSAVNVRLLSRAATKADKKLVIVTSNESLAGLAASAGIPVAKNLQSPPKIARALTAAKAVSEIEQESDDSDLDTDVDADANADDVIDGSQIAVGEHAGIDDDDTTEEIELPEDLDEDAEPVSRSGVPDKKRVKVPDFGSFRKKLFIGAGALVVLIAFFVWAAIFAPHASVIVSTKTSSVDINTNVTLGDKLDADPTKGTLPTITQTDKQSNDVTITPTGSKDFGKTATGTVVFSNCQEFHSVTIESGTTISSGGFNYTVQATVVVPAGDGSFLGCTTPGVSAPVKVVAADIGDDYNTSAGASFSVSGFSNNMKAVSDNGITGGESHTGKYVTTEDVQKAIDDMSSDSDDEIKGKLKSMLGNDTIIIDSSFSSSVSKPKVSPDVGEEVKDGVEAKLTVTTTSALSGVSKQILDEYLKTAITEQLGDSGNKRIYDTGIKNAKFSDYEAQEGSDNQATVTLTASGSVGVKLSESDIRTRIAGKLSGEAIDSLNKIDGVEDTSVDLSPFWVRHIPSNPDKVSVEFKLIKND